MFLIIFGSVLTFTAGLSCETPCPMIIDYVCGTDGETYTNECLLQNEACDIKEKGNVLLKAYDGECIHNAGKMALKQQIYIL